MVVACFRRLTSLNSICSLFTLLSATQSSSFISLYWDQTILCSVRWCRHQSYARLPSLDSAINSNKDKKKVVLTRSWLSKLLKTNNCFLQKWNDCPLVLQTVLLLEGTSQYSAIVKAICARVVLPTIHSCCTVLFLALLGVSVLHYSCPRPLLL